MKNKRFNSWDMCVISAILYFPPVLFVFWLLDRKDLIATLKRFFNLFK